MPTYLAGAHLRWVKRTVVTSEEHGIQNGHYIKVLQQGFQPVNGGPLEWKDVPEFEEPPVESPTIQYTGPRTPG